MAEKRFDLKEYAKVARQAVAEGVVLLKNDKEVLPLPTGSKVALFGRSQFNYYKSGTGSGGSVNTRYVVGIAEALESEEGYIVDQIVKQQYQEWLKDHPFEMGGGWAQEPWYQEEMPLTREMVEDARKRNETAIIVLARTAGEDKDNKAEQGSYLLTEAEEAMLDMVCSIFDQTIVLLNVGNIIDMKWVEKYNPSAVLYVWQGGQEGGNGVLDVLNGTVNPSGKLTDTIAKDIYDYPSTKYYGDPRSNIYAEDIYVGYRYFETFAKDRVLYPFGYGLSYTRFSITCEGLGNMNSQVSIRVAVTNVGNVSGKEVVQIYCEAPCGKLGKPKRVLVGFAKTKSLDTMKKEEITIEIPYTYFASYDDSGITGHKSAWVLEEGEYNFYLGGDVRSAVLVASIRIDQLLVVEQLSEAMAPVIAFERICAKEEEGIYYEEAPLRTVSPMDNRKGNIPEDYGDGVDKGYKLADVASGKITMEDFLGQLNNEDLCCLVRGEGMSSPKVTPGTASAFGGVTNRLLEFGIPLACASDGPSGIRMDCGNIAFSLPNGTCLASSWNGDLITELYEYEGLELRKNRIDTLLGPGINIHRNPLNGRNFEYFSEDPLLTGKIAIAQLNGMHKYGVTGTIKHFACNNQEYERNFVDAIVSERALREIYLRAFELAVKEGNAISIMSSYNPVNGLWTASHYDLLTTILRKQWGYKGIVMTDWWAKGNDEGEPATIENVASMVRAQNDLYMVVQDAQKNTGKDNSMKAMEEGSTTRGEYLRSASNICNYLITTPAWLRHQGIVTELDEQLQEYAQEEDGVILDMTTLYVSEYGILPGDSIHTNKGQTTHLQVSNQKRGFYRIEITCRAAEGTNELAQIPLTIFYNNNILKTITLNGSDRQWRTEVIDLPEPLWFYTFYLKLFFGQSGMEIKDLKVVLVQATE